MPRQSPGAVAILALALALSASACGAAATTSTSQSRALAQCRTQWRGVAQSVAGLDADTNPSALASRWTTVIATVAYYENTTTAKGCSAAVTGQVRAINALRDFSIQLRPYDMAYQAQQVAPAVDLYLNDPLPAPTRNAKGKKVAPPSKQAVTAAAATLTQLAAGANADLAPAWEQFTSVEITDAAGVKTAMDDLANLAQTSTSWTACEQALQVIMAAEQAKGINAPVSTPTG